MGSGVGWGVGSGLLGVETPGERQNCWSGGEKGGNIGTLALVLGVKSPEKGDSWGNLGLPNGIPTGVMTFRQTNKQQTHTHPHTHKDARKL